MARHFGVNTTMPRWLAETNHDWLSMNDWQGVPAEGRYQYYFSERQIAEMFKAVGIHPDNVLRLQKGLYKVRAGRGPVLDDTLHSFGAG